MRELWAHLLECSVEVDLFGSTHSGVEGLQLHVCSWDRSQLRAERQFMVHGRWRSDCVRKYMYLSSQDEAKLGVVAGMHQIPA